MVVPVSLLVRQGLSVAELRLRLKEEEAARRREKLAAESQTKQTTISERIPEDVEQPVASSTMSSRARQDSSPIKVLCILHQTISPSYATQPLSSILNLEKLLTTPHTTEQISLLWRAYHASRSNGTGRGYLCATIPVGAYEKMLSVASRYPYFVVPVPKEGTRSTDHQTPEGQRAHEFYFMEWGLHGPPIEPRPTSADPFAKPKISANPHLSTILFTPLQEYKLRTSFATPYLVLTNYTELAHSHGIVLLRGEITPSASQSGSYMLNQQDAQLLAMGAQKFYLWSDGQSQRQELLRSFHENPANFKWEELLKHTDFSA